ncbi:hypothetical protein BJX66DRAFT_298836 [Aspergillus keveii]|uniref:Uncharacterized protein n=1 Tax=Aspergillus keveii TaxID=714993 RepID=A0ABR4GCU3_9EURO
MGPCISGVWIAFHFHSRPAWLFEFQVSGLDIVPITAGVTMGRCLSLMQLKGTPMPLIFKSLELVRSRAII